MLFLEWQNYSCSILFGRASWTTRAAILWQLKSTRYFPSPSRPPLANSFLWVLLIRRAFRNLHSGTRTCGSSSHLCHSELSVVTSCMYENGKQCVVMAYRCWMPSIKARLHIRFLMRFCMQNTPYPTLHKCVGFFLAKHRLDWNLRMLSHIIWRHRSFQFLLTWRYFVAALRD